MKRMFEVLDEMNIDDVKDNTRLILVDKSEFFKRRDMAT